MGLFSDVIWYGGELYTFKSINDVFRSNMKFKFSSNLCSIEWPLMLWMILESEGSKSVNV